MPSIVHQWLVLWVARKLSVDGFLIGGYEGPTPHGGVYNTLPIPFEIGAVRPDVWGVAPATGDLAIGEAKTRDDVLSSHTQKQLQVFGRLLQRDRGRLCKLYVAVPYSASGALDLALTRAGLKDAEHVCRVCVPDCLLVEDVRECA